MFSICTWYCSNIIIIFIYHVLCARFPESWDRADLGIFSVFSFDLVSQIVPFCFYINIELWLCMNKLNKLCFPTLALPPVLAGSPFGQRVLMVSNLHLVWLYVLLWFEILLSTQHPFLYHMLQISLLLEFIDFSNCCYYNISGLWCTVQMPLWRIPLIFL